MFLCCTHLEEISTLSPECSGLLGVLQFLRGNLGSHVEVCCSLRPSLTVKLGKKCKYITYRSHFSQDSAASRNVCTAFSQDFANLNACAARKQRETCFAIVCRGSLPVRLSESEKARLCSSNQDCCLRFFCSSEGCLSFCKFLFLYCSAHGVIPLSTDWSQVGRRCNTGH